jgi:hypothetical protein
MKINILPNDVIEMVRAEGDGLEFGCVSLNIFFRNGKPRWEVSRSRSIIDDSSPKGIDDVAYMKTTDDERITGSSNGK